MEIKEIRTSHIQKQCAFFYFENILYFIFNHTESEFESLAEEVKPFMEQRMKIEPFPWLRDYYVDMRELYTELTLEKIENKLEGKTSATLKTYEEMFFCKSAGKMSSQGKKKVLFKGEQGMGKSTLGRKMGWDWAKGIFKVFSIVFFVALKFVKPGEPIENIILNQHPELEGMNVTKQKLHGILHRFGNRCLLILDGLDECGKNEDILKIIRNQKLLNCSIVVSSRPHSTREIERFFPNVVRLEGFTEKEAKKFVYKFFQAEFQVTKIVNFKPSGFRENFSIHKCPILLAFLCVLVRDEEVDLSDETISIGDIYTKMVRCLYKKFLIKRNAGFEESEFVDVLKSVGKLALKTLISNNPLLQKSEIDKNCKRLCL